MKTLLYMTIALFFRFTRHFLPYNQEEKLNLESLKKLATIKKIPNPKTNRLDLYISLNQFPQYSCIVINVLPPTAAPYALYLVYNNNKTKIGVCMTEHSAIEKALLTLFEYGKADND